MALRYRIHQKITPFANQYQVFEAVGGQPGALVAFAHQKRLAIKEAFMFYADEARQTLAFEVKARNIMEAAATYDVRDANGQVLGSLKKVFGSSLLRSTWHIYAPGGGKPIAVVRERSLPVAVARRIWQFLPILSDIPFFIKFHFDFIDPATGAALGTYNKTTVLLDHYQLDISDELAAKADWRVFAAMGVGLDALQSR